MRFSKTWVALSVVLAGFQAAPATAADGSSRVKCRWFPGQGPTAHEIDLSIQRKAGVVLKGPKMLTIRPINRLRYDVVIGNEVVTSPGPNLGLARFSPAFPAPVSTQAGQAAAAAATGVPAPAAPAPMNLAATIESMGLAAQAMLVDDEEAAYRQKLDLFRRQLGNHLLAGLVDWAEQEGQDRKIKAEDVIELVFARLQAELAAADAELAAIRLHATTVVSDLESAGQVLEDLIRRSDQLLGDDPSGGTLLPARTPVQTQVTSAVGAPWPVTEAPTRKLAEIGSELSKLPTLSGFPEWLRKCDQAKGVCNRGRHSGANRDVADLSKALSGYAKGSDAWKAQNELRTRLRAWLPILTSLTADSFRKTLTIECDYPFFDTRSTKIEVRLTDRLEKDKSKATQTLQVAEIVCPSHFAVTAGVGVAWILERDFAFVEAPEPPEPPEDPEEPEDPDDEEAPPDEDGLMKVFGFKNKSSEQINPTFLIHTRLTTCPEWDLHLSAGTVLDFDRPDNSSVFGYLGGLSLSLKERLFMTLGVQAQRVPELAGGFEVGDEVPADLTAPPLEQDWKFGAVLSVTFKMN